MCRIYYEKCFEISGAHIEKSIHWTNKLFVLVSKRRERCWGKVKNVSAPNRNATIHINVQLQLFYKHQNNCEIEKRVKCALRHLWAQSLEVGEQQLATETIDPLVKRLLIRAARKAGTELFMKVEYAAQKNWSFWKAHIAPFKYFISFD